MDSSDGTLTSFEICAGMGGQALGLEQAGFGHEFLVEWEKIACETLKANRPDWKVHHGDLREYVESGEAKRRFRGEIDLLAGGVPCPPFSYAGHQLGKDDERDLFPTMVELAEQIRPKAIMIENVRGLALEKFSEYRRQILGLLQEIKTDDGKHPLYQLCGWRILHAEDYEVPQQRPRSILVMMQQPYAEHFYWPKATGHSKQNLAELLESTMRERGLKGKKFTKWYGKASVAYAAPTLVGGSKKHGGADLGPTRAKRAWGALGINGMGVADHPTRRPDREINHDLGPMLTVRQAAMIQGFPDDWEIKGRKTEAYRQVGNAFPPPVARAVGERIKHALERGDLAKNGVSVPLPEIVQQESIEGVIMRRVKELSPVGLF
ncbi:DNA cytosine methyltransferase [Actinacidiphila oryziradicis]|uniref:Cytosine-specific methyltransferase n=1 Tax=Actinacidiphila oryziradicis TaxID=2571141 RepID=A0A4U0RZB9_9ACTN|nr:DNA (cytosine-5-)-methyltransferase [Actinacidiphila oryziradicis]TKA00171.1 DNA (cytosine-5-)-methyltransferase [Actinacidiphila oryziradicis]